jgi:hypothetical protein
VDAESGKQKWSYDNHGTWIIASPAIHDGTVYAGTSIPGLIRALAASTGQQRYEVDAASLVFSSAAIAGDLAYVGAFNGKLYAMDLRTGRFAWEFQTEAGKRDPLHLTGAGGKTDENRVFRSHFFDDMYRAGERLFSLGSILSSPTVDKGVVYVGSTDGNLYALD